MRKIGAFIFVVSLVTAVYFVLTSSVSVHTSWAPVIPSDITVRYHTFEVFGMDWDELMKQVKDARRAAQAGEVARAAHIDINLNRRLAENLREYNEKSPEANDLSNGVMASSVKYLIGMVQDAKGKRCFLTGIHISGQLTIYLPQWQDYLMASPDMQEQWNNYYSELFRKQMDGISNILQATRRIEQNLATIRDVDCNNIEQRAQAEFHQEIGQYAAKGDIPPLLKLKPAVGIKQDSGGDVPEKH